MSTIDPTEEAMKYGKLAYENEVLAKKNADLTAENLSLDEAIATKKALHQKEDIAVQDLGDQANLLRKEIAEIKKQKTEEQKALSLELGIKEKALKIAEERLSKKDKDLDARDKSQEQEAHRLAVHADHIENANAALKIREEQVEQSEQSLAMRQKALEEEAVLVGRERAAAKKDFREAESTRKKTSDDLAAIKIESENLAKLVQEKTAATAKAAKINAELEVRIVKAKCYCDVLAEFQRFILEHAGNAAAIDKRFETIFDEVKAPSA